MRSLWLALLAGAALIPCAQAGDLRNFDDAALHAVQFVDRNEGWAVGDEGVVWHTIDGGATWERQPTGVRASLRSVCFLNPYTGWVAGREELPGGQGGVGVLLLTRDGGLKWKRVTLNSLPGLQRVWFHDDKSGFVAGDGTDAYPTGVFRTSDGGRSWQPVQGPRCPGWLAADSADGQSIALGGAWNRLALLRGERLVLADVDWLGGRSLRGLQMVGQRGIAVGQGGLILISDNTAGAKWGLADLQLSPEILACCDFQAVHCVGKEVWVVGRPGSVVLHSADQGETWDWRPTGQPLPLNGVFFMDEAHGWAVGEFGTIVGTQDGGKSWKVQRRGGQRAAVMLVQAAAEMPLDTAALLGGEEGYLTTALRVVAADPRTAAFAHASDGQRLDAALREVGGAAGEMLWQFPLPQHLARCDAPELIKAWDKTHGDQAAQDLLRQLVLSLRMWRPNVVVTDAGQGDSTALVAEAVREAYQKAADPKVFPEQIARLGLQPWSVGKLYARCDDPQQAQVKLDTTKVRSRLQTSAREFSSTAARLITEEPTPLPGLRLYRLLEARTEGAAGHVELMQGIPLAPGGEAMRNLSPVADVPPEISKAIATRRTLQALSEAPASPLTDANKLLTQIGPILAALPDDQAAPAAYALAEQFRLQGQWELAREIYQLLVDHYPTHPRAADGCRQLIGLCASSELRRRHELGQFAVISSAEFHASQKDTKKPSEGLTPDKPDAKPTPEVKVEVQQTSQVSFLEGKDSAKQWYESAVQLEPRLAAFGSLFANDPSVQFCLQAARRSLGDFETAKRWYTQFAASQPPGPWRDAALTELWLDQRNGAPPKPIALCRQISSRPVLDGDFEDACWQGGKPLTLSNATGETTGDYPTEARLAYDKDFLYLAVRCKHPADRYVAPVKLRKRDEDLHAYDRVTLMLDLDRDYHTYYQLHIDQRGCVREDCWGDLSWNPRWFVAVKSDSEGWRAEVAIPLAELTGEPVANGTAWACNIVRILPGRGVQSWSLPADVRPRPEGMGLLIFTKDPATAARPANLLMPRAP
jgi:photosystem II stability/assembly factor-like uncharacterized protein/tetratricopeptide (TPR) repeat protein